jgi:hypothetical protein
MAKNFEAGNVEQTNFVTIDGNGAIGTQLCQSTIKVGYAQAEHIAHDFLR